MRNQAKIFSHFRQFLIETGASARTQKNYLFDVQDFFEWFAQAAENKDIQECTKTDIEAYVAHQLKQGKSKATINRKLSSLRILFTSLKDTMTAHPLAAIRNLDLDQELLPHKPMLQAYEANLKHSGLQSSELVHHKTVVTDFLRWISRKTPS